MVKCKHLAVVLAVVCSTIFAVQDKYFGGSVLHLPSPGNSSTSPLDQIRHLLDQLPSANNLTAPAQSSPIDPVHTSTTHHHEVENPSQQGGMGRELVRLQPVQPVSGSAATKSSADVGWLEAAMKVSREAYTKHKRVVDCNETATRSGTLSRTNNTAWLFQSIGSKGEQKRCGGDDIYASINSTLAWEHVATVTDHENGTYTVWFDQSCGEEISGRLSIIVQFSRGEGMIADLGHRKDTIGEVAHEDGVIVHGSKLPRSLAKVPMRVGELSNPLTNYRILAFGDSLTLHICSGPWTMGRVLACLDPRLPLNSASLQPWHVNPLKRWVSEYNKTTNKSQFVVLRTSGIWNIIRRDLNPENQEKSSPENLFRDHLESLAIWIEQVQKIFPEATILWKEISALHAHRAACNVGRKKWYSCMWVKGNLNNKLNKLLLDLQEIVLRAKGVTVLRRFNLQARHSLLLAPGDGMHYIEAMDSITWNSWMKNEKGQWVTHSYECPRDLYQQMAAFSGHQWQPSVPCNSQELTRFQKPNIPQRWSKSW